MSKVSVAAFSISIDGFGAGPDQSREEPLGRGGEGLHDWFVPTRGFRRTYGEEGGSTGIDDSFGARSMENLGAWIMGRNMFGPERSAWSNPNWKGWWGKNPPYHADVFVLTHYPRTSIEHPSGGVVAVLCQSEIVYFNLGISGQLDECAWDQCKID